MAEVTAGAAPTSTVTTTKSSGGSFLAKKWGPLPVWAYALGGGALLGGVYFLRKKSAASKAGSGSVATNTSNLCVDSAGNVAPCNGGCTDANGNAVNCTSTDTYTADLITSQYDTLESQLQAIQNGTGGGSNTLNVCVDQYGNIVNCGSPDAVNSGTVATSSTGTVTTGSQTVGVTGSGKGTAPTTVVAGGGTTTGGGSTVGNPILTPGLPSKKVPPKMPSGVKGVAPNSSSVSLSWPAVYGATSYQVRITYQTKLVGSQTVTGTSATISGLTANHTYTGHVKACNSAGCSSETNGPVVKTPR